MHGEGGQATVEWMALVLVAALVLGAAAALAGREDDHGLGEAVAKRIVGAPGSPAGGVPGSPAGDVPALHSTAGAAPATGPPAVGAFRALRGMEDVAKHTWIVCLGYKRWRYELETPRLPNEAVPFDQALDIVNGCLNPYDYLLED